MEIIIDIGQVWVSHHSWGDIEGIYKTSDEDKVKFSIVKVDGDEIFYKIVVTEKTKDLSNINTIFSEKREEFLSEFKQFPFVDITPEEIVRRLDQSILSDDFPFAKRKHLESVIAIKAQIAMNDNKPLYCLAFDNGKHFKVVSVYWKDLKFIMKHYSDGSLTPNINRLNTDHVEAIKKKQLHIDHRRPMWFKPHTVTTQAHLEGSKWIPESTRFIDWDSPEGDKMRQDSYTLGIWQWENNLGFYKLYRVTTPEKIDLFI